MTQVAWLKHATGVEYRRPVDEYMMYTDTDFEYHSHLSTTFNLTLNQYSLHIQVEEISTEGPTHIYSRVLLNLHALHEKGQTEVDCEL